jgi:hypothetical protein
MVLNIEHGNMVFVHSPSLLSFLNISCNGLVFGGLGGDSSATGELDLLKLANIRGCIERIEANRDVIVGVKVRLSDSICDNGENESEAYRHALEAGREVNLPLMVYHSFSTIPLLEECPGGCAVVTFIHTRFMASAAGRILSVRTCLSAQPKGLVGRGGHGSRRLSVADAPHQTQTAACCGLAGWSAGGDHKTKPVPPNPETIRSQRHWWTQLEV